MKEKNSKNQPINQLAEKAANIAIQFANNESVSTDKTINNGKIEVPATLLEPISVTKSNIEEIIIEDGYLTQEEIYGN